MTGGKKKSNTPARYVCIVKVGDNEDGSAKCVKYHTNNLVNFVQFLDTDWKGWRYFNVFSKKTNEKLASFSTNNRPKSMFVKES